MSNTKKINTLHISGMSCVNCAKGIERHLNNKGIDQVQVDFANSELHYELNDNLSHNDLINEIESIGFKVNNETNKEDNTLEKLFAFCLLLTLPLFCHMFLEKEHFLHNPILQFCLALPVYIVGCYYFGRSAWASIKNAVPNMDVLVMMGTTATMIYSIVGTLNFWGTPQAHQYLFFETTATIITLVLLGNLLEHRSVKKTTSAIKELSAIQNLIVKKELKDGTIVDTNYNDIIKGDILLVNSGDKVPTDGKIVSGQGYFDESMMTGENQVIYKKEHQNIVGGTILTEGNIKMIAQKVGKDTVLSHIINLVKKAQNSKPNIQRLGDKISSIFVPLVLVIALISFVINYMIFDISFSDSLMRSIAVLVISCPCAMGLATPTAVMVGLGRAAKMGILIKGGHTLEEFSKIKHIVFDKTGTLTTGNFNIDHIEYTQNQNSTVNDLLYSLELHSSHPIAKSILKNLEDSANILELKDIKEVKGQGIQATYKDDVYQLGSSKFVGQKEGKSQFLLTKNGQLLAQVYCSDQQREGLKETVIELKKEDLSIYMLSGDKIEKCQKLAQEIGINKVFAEQLPQQKLEQIEQLNNQALTAMVGDGINDAPALAKAHVGISLGGSTEVAIDSAQIVLLNKNNLHQLVQAFKISKHTLLTIKQNLFWAFSYNIIAIPIAAMGFLNPMWGALFMAFSDVIVIGNSLRLKNKSIF